MVKARKKFAICLCVFALALIIAVTLLASPVKAVADATTTREGFVEIGSESDDLYKGGSKPFDGVLLFQLYNALGFDSYDALEKAAQTPITSEAIRNANDGQNVSVWLGEMRWDVVYVTLDKDGNVIADLWLSGGFATDKCTFTPPDRQLTGVSASNSQTATCPANSYGTSWINTAMLNNAGWYALSKDNWEVEYTPTEDHRFARFTMPSVEGSLTDYIVVPERVAYQETEACPGRNGYDYYWPNEAYGTPKPGYRWFSNTDGSYDYTGKHHYTDWKNSYLWLPSMVEATTASDGIWITNSNLLTSHDDEWLRTGAYSAATSARIVLNGSAESSGDYLGWQHYVAPAFHLNLTAVDGNIGLFIEDDKPQGQTETKTYDGTEQTLQLPQLSEDVVYTPDGDGAFFDAATKTIKATEVGVYKVTLTPKENSHWNGILDDSGVVYQLTIDPASVSPQWTIGSYTYNGTTLQIPTATATGVGGDGTFDLTVKLTDPQGEFKNAGNYTFSAELKEENAKNYTLTGETTKTVNVAKVTVTAVWTVEDSYTYQKTPFETPTAKATGVDTDGELTLTVKLTTSQGEFKNAGEYTFTAELNEENAVNYILTGDATKTVTVEKATVQVPEITSKTYNGETQKADIAGTDEYRVTKNDGGVNAGTYDVVLTLEDDANYKWSDGDETAEKTLQFEIAKKKIIPPQIQNPEYTGDAQKPTVPESSDYKVKENNGGTGAGDYTLELELEDKLNTEWDGGDGSDTFKVEYKIEKKSVAIPEITSKVYNGSLQKADIQSTNEYNVVNDGGTTVGTYDVVLTLNDDANYKWADEDSSSTKTLHFEITKSYANAWTTEPSIADWTYGDSATAPQGQATFGDVKFEYATEESGVYSEQKPTQAGKYWLKATVEDNDNYNGLEKKVQFNVEKAQVSVQWNVEDYTYNGTTLQTPTATATGVGNDGTLTLNVKLTTPQDGEFKNAGEYAFTAELNDENIDSYTLTGETEKTVNIKKAEVEAEWAVDSYTYNGMTLQMPAATATGVGNDGTLTLTVTLTTPQGEFKNAGQYTFTAELSEANTANYTLTNETTTVNVEKADAATEWVVEKYTFNNTALQMPTAKAKGVSADGELTLTVRLTTLQSEFKDAGEYTFAAELKETDAENYTLTGETTKTFIVEKATVTIPEIASKTYNGENQIADVQGTDNYTVTTNNGGVNAGTYDVVLTLEDDTNYKWSDGDETAEKTLQFVIMKAENSWTVQPDMQGWTYGDSAAELQGQAAFGDVKFEYATEEDGVYSEQKPTNGGNYWMKATVEETDNYNGLEQKVQFTVEKAEVYVTWSTRSSYVYGTNFPIPTAKIDGVGDDGEIQLTVTLTNPSESEFKNAGDYTFTAKLNEENADNYTLQGASVTVTVKRATVQVPTIESKMFVGIGHVLTADIQDTDEYVVAENNGGDVVGKYNVVLRLQNVANYKWDGDDDSSEIAEKTLQFEITKKQITLPQIQNPEYTGDAQKATVPESDDYSVESNEGGTGAGDYSVELKLKDPDNTEWAGGGTENQTVEYKIEKKSVAIPEIASKEYNGETQTADVQGTIEYTVERNDGGITVGTYDVVLKLINTDNYKWSDGDEIAEKTLQFEIKKRVITPPSIENPEYTGETQKPDVPTSDWYEEIPSEGGTEAGDYSVELKLKDPDNTEWAGGGTENQTVEYKIEKKSVAIPEIASKTYNGETQKADIAGTDEYRVTKNDGGVNAGTYDVVLTLEDDANYKWSDGDETAEKTLQFVIDKATYNMDGVTFEDATVNYDGKAHSLQIKGDLPDGVTVTYVGNDKVESGVYTVEAKFTGDEVNYNAIESKTATLTILRNELSGRVEGNNDPDNPDVVVDSDNNGGIDPEWELVVEKLSGDIEKTLRDAEKLSGRDRANDGYNVKLMHNGVEVQPESKITIRLLIPQSLRGKNFGIFHIEGDDKITSVEYEIDGNYAVITVESLSEFVFVNSTLVVELCSVSATTVVVAVAVALLARHLVKKKKEN